MVAIKPANSFNKQTQNNKSANNWFSAHSFTEVAENSSEFTKSHILPSQLHDDSTTADSESSKA